MLIFSVYAAIYITCYLVTALILTHVTRDWSSDNPEVAIGFFSIFWPVFLISGMLIGTAWIVGKLAISIHTFFVRSLC